MYGRRCFWRERRVVAALFTFVGGVHFAAGLIAAFDGVGWYVYLGMIFPFCPLLAAFLWYVVKARVIPLRTTITELLRIGAFGNGAHSRYVRMVYCLWFVISVHLLVSAIVLVVTAIVLQSMRELV